MPHTAQPDPYEKDEFYRSVPTKRALALLVDLAVVLILSTLAALLTFGIGFFVFPAIFAVVDFIYRWSTLSGRGATWGMRLMAIEIHNRHGQRLDTSEALLHTLGFIFSCAVFPLQLISMVMMVASERRQGLTDMVLDTVMINRPAPQYV